MNEINNSQANATWEKAKEILKRMIPEERFTREIEPLELKSINETDAVIKGKSAYSNNSVEYEYGLLIQDVLEEIAGHSLHLSFSPSFPKPETNIQELSEEEIIWEKAKKICRKKLSPPLFRMWIDESLKVKSFDDNEMVLVINSRFKKEIVEEQFGQMIQNALSEVTGTSVQLSIIIEPSPPAPQVENELFRRLGWDQNVIDRTKAFTFDNFPETTENKRALASIRTAVDHPEKDLNPLFVYGLTRDEHIHLWHAIINIFADKNSSIFFVPQVAEMFIDEMIMDAKNNTNQYHKKYDQAEFLIISHFECIESSEYVQGEFSKMLDRMVMENKQIIVFSNRPINDLQLKNEDLKRLIASSTVVSVPKQ